MGATNWLFMLIALKIPAVDQGARRDLLCCSRDSFHPFEGGFNFRKLKCLPSYDDGDKSKQNFSKLLLHWILTTDHSHYYWGITKRRRAYKHLARFPQDVTKIAGIYHKYIWFPLSSGIVYYTATANLTEEVGKAAFEFEEGQTAA